MKTISGGIYLAAEGGGYSNFSQQTLQMFSPKDMATLLALAPFHYEFSDILACALCRVRRYTRPWVIRNSVTEYSG